MSTLKVGKVVIAKQSPKEMLLKQQEQLLQKVMKAVKEQQYANCVLTLVSPSDQQLACVLFELPASQYETIRMAGSPFPLNYAGRLLVTQLRVRGVQLGAMREIVIPWFDRARNADPFTPTFDRNYRGSAVLRGEVDGRVKDLVRFHNVMPQEYQINGGDGGTTADVAFTVDHYEAVE